MTRRDATPNRLDETDPLQDVIRYAPGLIAIVLTVGVSIVDHLPFSRPSLTRTVILAAIPASIVALSIARRDWNPSGSRFLALAILSWGVFSVVRIPLLDPASSRIDGSVFVLADLGLVWLGSYALAAAVVYGIDWPTPHVAPDGERDRSEAGPADD